MLQDIRKLTVPIIISISFFIFGFLVAADLFDLSLREKLIGLVAGAVGGTTTLLTVLHQMRAALAQPSSAT